MSFAGHLFGGGGGGSGLTLGPPTNSFNAATEALAEAARDTYAAANAAWLAQYDAEPTFTIEISWPVNNPTDTKYQSRRGGAWADVTGLIRGETGAKGAGGAQARFLVYRLCELRGRARGGPGQHDVCAEYRHADGSGRLHGAPRDAGPYRADLSHPGRRQPGQRRRYR